MTVLALLLAETGIKLEETYGVPERLTFVYGGGETGARSLLGAIARAVSGWRARSFRSLLLRSPTPPGRWGRGCWATLPVTGATK